MFFRETTFFSIFVAHILKTPQIDIAVNNVDANFLTLVLNAKSVDQPFEELPVTTLLSQALADERVSKDLINRINDKKEAFYLKHFLIRLV